VPVTLERIEIARKWMLKLREQELDKHEKMEPHCKQVLGKKNLSVFKEMLDHSAYGDTDLASDIEKGFDLMGHLPESNVFHKRMSFATLMPVQVRAVSAATRTAI